MSIILNEVLGYADRGWHLIQLHGVVSPEVCTCWKGKDCGTPGKHPVQKEWQQHATTDPEVIEGWFESGQPNVGLVMGPKSGVIDVELDGDEARQAWNDLKLGEIWTPTYTSGRGPHRLFKWSSDLPSKNVAKPLGIEIRIGNAGGVQSVLPPSLHHTGRRYEWVDGLGPDDVELAPLPERLLALLWNHAGSDGSAKRPPAGQLIHRTVMEGERNNELHRFAVREAFRSPSIDDPVEQQDLLVKIRMANEMNVKPPLSDDEAVAIFRSAIAYVRKGRSAGLTPAQAIDRVTAPAPSTSDADAQVRAWQRVFTETGLSYSSMNPEEGWDPEWGPGEWALTVVHSDPIEYRLHIPAWEGMTPEKTGYISLTVDQYRSAAKVAASVLAATGTVMLDDEPGKWKKIWDGGQRVAEGRDGEGRPLGTHRSRGVKAKLLDNVAHEYPGSSSLRYAMLSGWLYERLTQASQPSEDDVPDSTGRPCWRQDGTLWFSWSRVWEDIERQHRIQEGERLATKRRILAKMGESAKDFSHAEYKHESGARKSYVCWTARELAVLESLATERAPETHRSGPAE